MTKGMYATGNTEVETPPELFELLHQEFEFDLDVCATSENTKCTRFFSPEVDGLIQNWQGVCWMNPPYGNQISMWLKKAYEESLKGITVACLVPARTDTIWWHDYCMSGEIRFVKGRIKFLGMPGGAPFPSAVVVFGPRASLGTCTTLEMPRNNLSRALHNPKI